MEKLIKVLDFARTIKCANQKLKHYIKPKIVDQKYQRQFARIEKARIEADYTHLRKFTKEEAKEILSEAVEFVKMANQID